MSSIPVELHNLLAEHGSVDVVSWMRSQVADQFRDRPFLALAAESLLSELERSIEAVEYGHPEVPVGVMVSADSPSCGCRCSAMAEGAMAAGGGLYGCRHNLTYFVPAALEEPFRLATEEIEGVCDVLFHRVLNNPLLSVSVGRTGKNVLAWSEFGTCGVMARQVYSASVDWESEVDRSIEVVLHELGHFLGLYHSACTYDGEDTVMCRYISAPYRTTMDGLMVSQLQAIYGSLDESDNDDAKNEVVIEDGNIGLKINGELFSFSLSSS